MLLKRISILLLLLLSCMLFACNKPNNKVVSTKENKETEATVKPTEKSTEGLTEEPTTQQADISGSISVENPDGSIVKTWYERDKTTKKIEYSATNNETTCKEYKFDEYGVLYYECEYKGPGNLFEEFEAGNFVHATEESVLDNSNCGGYEVDIENAFTVTRADLAPLYAKAKTISDKYGVVILIADKIMEETGGAEPYYEYTKIDKSLDYIDKALSVYPKDFFKKFSDMNVDRTVCIQVVGTGYAPGVYLGGGKELMLQMDANCVQDEDDGGSFFIYTLHHEIGHAINARLFTRAPGLETALTEEKWNTYNPPGFEYGGDERENEVYLEGDNSLYFTYSYGCNNPEEDRATIFGYAMSYYHGFEAEDYSFNDKVDAKLKYLSECIRAGFKCDWEEKPAWEYILDV